MSSEGVEVKVSGLDELERALEKLPKDLADQIVKHTLKGAGEIVQKKMVELVPKDSGILARHIKVKVKLEGKKTSGDIGGVALVGPDKTEHIEKPRRKE
jgi:hypothetical protein